MRLTSVFPGSIRPAQKGVYQRHYTFVCGKGSECRWMYCYWNGAHWFSWATTVQSAMDMQMKAFNQELPWRGRALTPTYGAV